MSTQTKDNIMKALREMLSEENGQLSTMRVISSIIPLIIVGTWALVSIKNNQLISFDLNDVLALSVPLGAKAYQRGKEVK